MAVRTDFIKGLPKVELHLHIEGSLEPRLMFELAQRNHIKIPFQSVEEVAAAYNFSNLQDFLDIYYQGMNVLQTQEDFFDLTWAYLERVAGQQVRHTEIFFDPQGHTERGVPFDVVLEGITGALAEGEERLGITSRLIMCFLRHLPEASAIETLGAAAHHKHLIAGVGLDSSEVGHPPSRFKHVFAMAREQGYKIVAHAGEEGPPEYVWEALDILGVDRIDHGNRALEDLALTDRLVAQNVALTVCPLSNLKLCVVDDLKSHPLKRMLAIGLKATVNSDDPSYFGGYMNENLVAVADALDLSEDEVVQLARNSIDASFVDPTRKSELHRELDQYVSTPNRPSSRRS